MRPSAFAVLRLMTSSNLVGCSNRQVAGLGALQDLVDEGRGAAPKVHDVGAVRHQATRFDAVPELVHRCQPVPYPNIREPRVVGLESRIAYDKDRAGSPSRHCGESTVEILGPAGFHRMKLEPEPLRCNRKVLPHKCLARVSRVDEHRHELRFGTVSFRSSRDLPKLSVPTVKDSPSRSRPAA